MAANHLAAGEHLPPPFADLLHRLLALGIASVREPLALGDQQHVLHFSGSFFPYPGPYFTYADEWVTGIKDTTAAMDERGVLVGAPSGQGRATEDGFD